MIEDKYYTPNLLEDLQVAVLESTGFNMTFVEKPLTEGYESILDNHLIFDLWKQDITDGKYADYFKLLYYKDFVFKNGVLYTYNGVYWKKDNTRKAALLSSRIDKEFTNHIVKRAFDIRTKIENDKTKYEKRQFLKIDEEEQSKDKEEEEEEEREQPQEQEIPMSSQDVLDLMKKKWGSVTIPNDCKDDPVVYLLQTHIKTINTYIKAVDKYLRNVYSRDKLVKDCCRVFQTDWIEFDMNEYLLAFENRIYDLQSGQWVTPKYDQYISITTGWKWVQGYNSRYKNELNRLFKQIFPDKEVRDLYLEILSTGLYGKVIQHFFVAKGRGGNGKSVINSLTMKAVGNYGYKLPSSALTQSIKTGANPEIANLHNKRFVLCQEPEESKKICCNTVKEITGDKAINARTLYSEDTVTRITLSLLLEANGLPQLDVVDDGTGRRVTVVPYDSSFLTPEAYYALNEEDKNSGRYFIRNTYYTGDEFQEQFKQALIEILMESFQAFQARGYEFHQPKQVLEEADDYLKTSDDFYGWFNEKFVKDENEVVKFKDLYDLYINSRFYNNMTKQDKRKHNQKYVKDKINGNMFLRKYFKRKIHFYNAKRLTADSIVGWRLKRYNEDDEDDEDDFEEETDDDISSDEGNENSGLKEIKEGWGIYEMDIDGKLYYVRNKNNGPIHKIRPKTIDDDVGIGKQIGELIDGKPKWF